MRTGYKTRPYEKLMEVFQNFSGGLNTVTPPDGMLDSELTDMLNEDLGDRGSLKRRHGLRKVHDLVSGKTQGYFRFYKTDGTYDELFAIGGKLYKGTSTTALTITGLSSFQSTRDVEGIQYGDKLYIATGTKLLTYDGTTCKVVDPYLPTTMEMTYVGPNALADNPEGHLQDTTGLVASVDYILPVASTLAIGKKPSIKVYGTKIDGETYQYALDTRPIAKQGDDWMYPNDTSSNWKSLASDKSITAPKGWGAAGTYEVRIIMRKTGDVEILSEITTQVTVTKTLSTQKDSDFTVHQCNRVLLHWDRLFLYGDPDNPTTLYMSQVKAPNYFPALYNIEFDNPRREEITTIVHYRNTLVVFTKTSVQSLSGTSPDDYKRVMLHTDLGCIAPKGAAVMKNHVGFLSLQGVFVLKTIGLTDDKASVEKIDIKIANLIPQDTGAIAVYNDSQLQITFPGTNQRFRFYEELSSWTKDYSTKFAFTNMYILDADLYALGPNTLYVFDRTVFQDDDYVYTNMWETKYFNFGQPYHKKKLKELQVLTAPKNDIMSCIIYVTADETDVITPDSEGAVIENNQVVWQVISENNFKVDGGAEFDGNFVLGESAFGATNFSINKLRLTGKCLRTKIKLSNTDPKENHFIGFSYIFKAKKP